MTWLTWESLEEGLDIVGNEGAAEEIHPGVTAHPSVFEMTWAPDGRATFSYSEERITGKPHVIWRRIGTHPIFTRLQCPDTRPQQPRHPRSAIS